MTEGQKIEEPKTGNGALSIKKGIDDDFARIVETVSRGMTGVAQGAGRTEAITDVVKSALDGCLAVGGNLILGAKAIVVGVLRGAGEMEAAGLKTLSHTARTLIRRVDSASGDVAAAAKGLVLGAIASAKVLKVELAKSASTAAQGALEGAEEAGSVASDTVRTALKESIGGLKIVLPGSLSR